MTLYFVFLSFGTLYFVFTLVKIIILIKIPKKKNKKKKQKNNHKMGGIYSQFINT